MLLSFLNSQDILEVREICEKLTRLKKGIAGEEADDSYYEYGEIKPEFDVIKDRALNSGNDDLANSQAVFKAYYQLFINLAKYRDCLLNAEFRKSWDVLQDCFDDARFVGRFTPIEHRLDVPDIVEMLEDYERLYPYVLFFSPEFVVTESHCSICGKSMRSLSCPHRKGQIYRGDVAKEIVDEIKTIQAVCLVNNPENKRCVIENADGNPISFDVLEEFIKLKFPWFQRFSIEKRIERRADTNIKITGRNDPCTCGSGLKFKKCCGKNLYYDHLNYVIIPGERVELFMARD